MARIPNHLDNRAKQFFADMTRRETPDDRAVDDRRDLLNKIPPELRKRLEEFARMAVAPTRGVSKEAPASWVYDRNEFVKHYAGSTYIAISAIARRVAMQGAQIAKKRIDKTGVHLDPVPDGHPLRVLFREVNQIHVEYDLWFYTVMWRYITGESYWWKARNGFGVPKELWPIPSQWVRAIPSPTKYIGAYEVRGVFSDPVELEPKDIVVVREPNPDWSGNGRYYGFPPMRAAATMIDVEESMLSRLLNHFRNYAPPGLAYSTDEILTEDQVLDIYSQLVTQHSMAEQTGRPIISHSGMRVSEFSDGVREMDYKGSLDTALEYQLAIHGVPKAVVGLVKDTNRSNMQGALLAWCENTINPLLVHLGQTLTQQLAHDFGKEYVVHFKPCTVDDMDTILRTIDVASKAGATTPNELRELLLHKPIYERGGDIPLVPINFAQATFGNGPDLTPAERAAEAELRQRNAGAGPRPKDLKEDKQQGSGPKDDKKNVNDKKLQTRRQGAQPGNVNRLGKDDSELDVVHRTVQRILDSSYNGNGNGHHDLPGPQDE